MKRFLSLTIILLFFLINICAQNKKAQITKEEFRQRQETFFTQKAGLTQDEANKFFPIYFDLQNKKKAINDKVWALTKNLKNRTVSEAEYDKILKELSTARINSEKLDYDYISHFRKVISAEKLYKIKMAEIKFHKEMLKIINKQNHKQK